MSVKKQGGTVESRKQSNTLLWQGVPSQLLQFTDQRGVINKEAEFPLELGREVWHLVKLVVEISVNKKWHLKKIHESKVQFSLFLA